jgi:hypothetical protein
MASFLSTAKGEWSLLLTRIAMTKQFIVRPDEK